MTDLEKPALSLEFVDIPIVATELGVPVDPTGDSVQIAVVPDTTTLAADFSDFHAATWETDTTTTPTTYIARTLTGPASLTPTIAVTRGRYACYARVTDTPEIPVIFGYYIVFT